MIIVGIDLGTTNSVASILQNGNPIVIKTKNGDRILPSVVSFPEDGGKPIVGELARRQSISNPLRTISSIKRHMGEKDFFISIDSKKYKPEEISAFILSEIKSSVANFLQDAITSAVITVPAYFNDIQRAATTAAGKIAGWDVARIINEPTAAALAYGMHKKNKKETILVYDLGGGTFDVSILKLEDGVFEVLATTGDNHLGGDDVDQKILFWLLSEFDREHNIDLASDVVAKQRLLLAAEDAKKTLSTADVAFVSIPYIYSKNGTTFNVDTEITKTKFEALVGDLLRSTIQHIEKALQESGLERSQIDEILFVGGSTRISMVDKIVTDFFQKKPKKDIDPDEIVSMGACIQGGIIQGDVSDILLVDVIPLSLGIEEYGGKTSVLIPSNTSIPQIKKSVYTTVIDNQDRVEIHVVQGERKMAADNQTLGRFTLTGIEKAPRGIPQIEVTFNVDNNGMLKVSAKDLKTNEEKKISIRRPSMSEEEINDAIKTAKEFEEIDKINVHKLEIKSAAEQLQYQVAKTISDSQTIVDGNPNLKKQSEEVNKKISKILVAVSVKTVSKDDKFDVKKYEKSVEEVRAAFLSLKSEIRKLKKSEDGKNKKSENNKVDDKNISNSENKETDKKKEEKKK